MKATLTYHSIDESGSPISVPPAVFESHLKWFTSGRVRVLPLDDLVAQPDHADDAVAITFDDGIANTAGAVTALLDAGLPVTVFVVSGRVGNTNAWGGRPQPGIPTLPLLTWDALKSLADRGAAIAPHTRTHPVLTRLSLSAVEEEVLGSRDDLRTHLGVQSAHFAYPYGHVNDVVASRVARHYRFGHTADFRCVMRSDDPHRLPRLDLYYFRKPGVLDTWGRPSFTRRLAWCGLRRTIRARLKATLPG